MPIIECRHCDEGPCRMVESVNTVDFWPSSCMKGLTDDYVEWVRLKDPKKFPVIKQPIAMRKEVLEFLAACMNTGSGSKNLEIMQTVGEIIDQYISVGE